VPGSVDTNDNQVYRFDNHVVHNKETLAMPLIRHADSRRTETPNAVMTTLASPTLGGAGQAVWRVDMRPAQAGPLHAWDAELVWTVLEGGAAIELDGETLTIGPGDTLIMPPDVPRGVTADSVGGLAAIVAAPAGARAYTRDGRVAAEAIAKGCAVPDAEKLAPAWAV
jgi:quercetin dioxygenase-like cupin family protein